MANCNTPAIPCEKCRNPWVQPRWVEGSFWRILLGLPYGYLELTCKNCGFAWKVDKL